MITVLQFCVRFVLVLSAKLGLVFMIVCTALVTVSLICGDIKISIVRSENEKEEVHDTG